VNNLLLNQGPLDAAASGATRAPWFGARLKKRDCPAPKPARSTCPRAEDCGPAAGFAFAGRRPAVKPAPGASAGATTPPTSPSTAHDPEGFPWLLGHHWCSSSAGWPTPKERKSASESNNLAEPGLVLSSKGRAAAIDAQSELALEPRSRAWPLGPIFPPFKSWGSWIDARPLRPSPQRSWNRLGR